MLLQFSSHVQLASTVLGFWVSFCKVFQKWPKWEPKCKHFLWYVKFLWKVANSVWIEPARSGLTKSNKKVSVRATCVHPLALPFDHLVFSENFLWFWVPPPPALQQPMEKWDAHEWTNLYKSIEIHICLHISVTCFKILVTLSFGTNRPGILGFFLQCVSKMTQNGSPNVSIFYDILSFCGK